MSGRPCADCFSGTIHEGTPSGTETTIHGLSTYVARPDGEPKGLIVIITDAFGWKFPNTRVLADKYAKKGGHLVYVPDVMNGPLSADVLPYMEKVTIPADWFTTLFIKPYYALVAASYFIPFLIRCRVSVCKPIVFEFFRALRTSPETANLKIGAAGFCWGGKHTVLLCHDTPSSRVHRPDSERGVLQSLVDAGFTAHPSFVKVPEDIDGITKPLSIAIGDVDLAMKEELVYKTKDILEKKKAGDHEVIVYPGAKHGFAIRGDPGDAKQKELGEEAEAQALKWFGLWLA